MAPRLADLARLAAMERDSESAKLAALKHEIALLRLEMTEVSAQPAGELLISGYAQSGGDRRWQAHVQARRREINSRLARLLADLDGQDQRTRRAVGRWNALDTLARQEGRG